MRARLRTEDSSDRRGPVRAGAGAGALTWALTFLLLALVLAIFALGGTVGESAGLFVRLVMLGFLVLAAVIFGISRNHRKIR